MNRNEQAKRHPISYEKPAPDFFEGALMGNGGLGAVVTTRPDAVVIHFGHNNVWDIRIAENNQEKIGTFQDVFEQLKQIPQDLDTFRENEWYREYCDMSAENYSKPYPRPMPCGSLLLGYDRRNAEVLGHKIHIHNGLCEVYFKLEAGEATLQLFIEPEADRMWMKLVSPEGNVGGLFDRVKLIPDPDTPKELPHAQQSVEAERSQLSFRQTLPCAPEGNERDVKDKAFRLDVRVAEDIEAMETKGGVQAKLLQTAPFLAYVELTEGLDSSVAVGSLELEAPAEQGISTAFAACENNWTSYWNCSGVSLGDEFLEQIWYWNLYFYHCSVKPEATCPGLFANWSYRSIGSEWHGDYHMNYNTQQPFWLAFSSNHVDKHLAYVNMVDHILPVSRKWASEYYGMRGAYYPHSAYPVEMNIMPYPVPHWGWEVCETPWTVQSLWWHYLYTMDRDFLANRAFAPIKEAVLFLTDYMRRPDTHGEAWGDDRYHIFPTVVPELYELTPGFKKNYDCLVDLTLTKFVFHAFKEACEILGIGKQEEELLDSVQEILSKFPEYATAESQRGTVFVSVPGEDAEVVYNTPNGIMTIFPGEEHGLHSTGEAYQIALNSYLNHRNEGGNELVFYHLAGARMGHLDLEKFKRQISYCLLPNGTCTDRVLLSGGRYSDTLSFDFMRRVGIWFENFALPVVINECLLQSYNGILRLFPNWPSEQEAEFATLRAVGAFLVSASISGGEVQWVEIESEAGAELRFYNPWEHGAVCKQASGDVTVYEDIVQLSTSPGERIRLVKVNAQVAAS
ncbi:glycosyl hydrolase family 95 catalytic domain-containing protein [Paenibacillus sp. MAH-36]|uniref:Glycoside hydrolase N-terminal domain-containing protein n=1 Tax=Paenibacillus violae TaxID=3077234 RepID=A0ABU3RM03_9BACL|nr:glycoside hydrolase N-terminal domain-containing protein [Paenibacillus sp. PFR10]MDU0205322.1 glycoside hydrolase N-terminal domain-containing protein [Paenibacillus sp. PFR10]